MTQTFAAEIELLNPNAVRGKFSHALFDFDGTLSLVREGWQHIMASMFVEILGDLGTGESRDSLNLIVRDWMMRLTGKPTIHQMFELCDQIKQRGGTPLDPRQYKFEFLTRLERRMEGRISELQTGKVPPTRWLLPGSMDFLQGLQARGVKLHLASGTEEGLVKREAKLLGIDAFFEGRIFGAVDNPQAFSKRMVLQKVLDDHNISGAEVVSIGDGFVEIEDAKQLNVFALGVASHEADPVDVDVWKRERLIAAGADAIVPHFSHHQSILDFLFPNN